MIGKIWKKSKLKSEKIWKMRKKSRLNCEMIWKIAGHSMTDVTRLLEIPWKRWTL